MEKIHQQALKLLAWGWSLLLGLFPGPLSAEPYGWIDGAAPGGVTGWAAEPGDATSLSVYLELFAVDAGGNLGGLVAEEWLSASGYRPDVPAAEASIVGDYHGWAWPIDPPPGPYMVRARAGAGTYPFLNPGEVRFARVEVPPFDVWMRARGGVSGLERSGDYESYPTAMWTGSRYEMWFAGGPGDKIYQASSASPLGGWSVYGSYTPVVSESPGEEDAGLVADPSVVLIPFADEAYPYRYFMYYTGTPYLEGWCNSVFGALSVDGISWSKMDPSDHSFGDTGPLISPLHGCWEGDYGVGQSSVIYGTYTLLGVSCSGFVQFFTDTTTYGPNLGISADGGWSFSRLASPLPLGEYTWDWKFHTGLSTFLGAVAMPGTEVNGTGRRHGSIKLTASQDASSWVFPVEVPMKWLTTDADHRCINNGGLLGNAYGQIDSNYSVFYFGAGYGMQSDAYVYGAWPPNDWEMHAVELFLGALPEEGGDDDTPPPDDDTTPMPDDDSTPVSDDDSTPPPDDDTTVADDDASASDDDTTSPLPPGNDDYSGACGGCNASESHGVPGSFWILGWMWGRRRRGGGER